VAGEFGEDGLPPVVLVAGVELVAEVVGGLAGGEGKDLDVGGAVEGAGQGLVVGVPAGEDGGGAVGAVHGGVERGDHGGGAAGVPGRVHLVEAVDDGQDVVVADEAAGGFRSEGVPLGQVGGGPGGR
jgi:hypothetical protein